MGKVSNIIVRVLEDNIIGGITFVWFMAWVVMLIVVGRGEPPMEWFNYYITPFVGILLVIRTIVICRK